MPFRMEAGSLTSIGSRTASTVLSKYADNSGSNVCGCEDWGSTRSGTRPFDGVFRLREAVEAIALRAQARWSRRDDEPMDRNDLDAVKF